MVHIGDDPSLGANVNSIVPESPSTSSPPASHKMSAVVPVGATGNDSVEVIPLYVAVPQLQDTLAPPWTFRGLVSPVDTHGISVGSGFTCLRRSSAGTMEDGREPSVMVISKTVSVPEEPETRAIVALMLPAPDGVRETDDSDLDQV